MRISLLTPLASRLDRQAETADAQAVAAGLDPTVTGRWSRTYRDPRVLMLRQSRAAGCFHVPMCALSAEGIPGCHPAVIRKAA